MTGQRIIDVDSVPKELSIESVETVDENVHIKWNKSSGQPDSVIPIRYLIGNFPFYEKERYKMTDYKSSSELNFFDYRDFIDKDGQKNKENVFESVKNC